MAVAFQGVASAVSSGSAVLTLGCTMTVAAGSNLALVCALITSGSTTITSVKWDTAGANQSMTLIKTATSSDSVCRVYLYGLVNPTPGASKLVTAIWTTSSTCEINAIAFTGVNQAGGVTSFANSVAADATGTAVSTGAITSKVGDIVCGSFGQNTGSVSSIASTTWFTDATHFGCGGNYATGASTVTLSAVVSASANWAYAGVDVVAAAINPKFARLKQFLRR